MESSNSSGEKSLSKNITPYPPEKRGFYLACSFFLIILITLIGQRFGGYLGTTNIGMLYLLPVILASSRLGVLPSIVVGLISVLSFDVFFVPPVLRVTVNDARYLITFVVFMGVAVTTGSMADRLRFRMKEAIHRETITRALYELARGLSTVSDLGELAKQVVKHVSESANAEVALYLPEKDGRLRVAAASKAFSDLVLGTNELAAAQWSFNHAGRSGMGTKSYEGAKGFYLPVITEEKTIGVLGVRPRDELFTPEQLSLLEALTGLTALAVVRLELAAGVQAVKTLEDSERLRSALFNSISHDMKTPLASIMGAITSLLDDGDLYDAEQKKTLLEGIKKGALRMNRVIENLLDMARLESGFIRLHTDWYDIQDIIGVSLRESREVLQEHEIKVELPGSTRLIKVDYGLIEQVITNLLHNAVKYSSAGSEILVSASEDEDQLRVSVADRGEGIPAGDEEKIFDKFYRLQSPGSVSGTGLGLSICRGIIEAHGGRIWAENRNDGGSVVSFTMMIDAAAPRSGGSWQEDDDIDSRS